MKKKLVLPLVLCLLCTGAFPCHAAEGAYNKVQKSFFGTFDTVITLIGYVREEAVFDEVYGEVQAQFQRYHQVYDFYTPYEGVSNLYYMNRNAANGPVEVEPELMELLLFCRDNQPKTAGTVNVALGAVLEVWHYYRDAGEADPLAAELPPRKRLESAAQHINFDDIVIDEEAGTVQYLDPQLRVDLGAVAKGYATERVGQWLEESGMPSFLLYAGGNVRTGNPPLDGRLYWGVGIQDPNGSAFSQQGEGNLDTLFVANTSVVTSGDYQRFYVVDGKRYHHLISPFTLMPADMFRSVTVVCEDSGLADLYSTAFFLLSYDEGRALADSLGVDVLWVFGDEEGTIEMTDGMRTRSKTYGGATARSPQ